MGPDAVEQFLRARGKINFDIGKTGRGLYRRAHLCRDLAQAEGDEFIVLFTGETISVRTKRHFLSQRDIEPDKGAGTAKVDTKLWTVALTSSLSLGAVTITSSIFCDEDCAQQVDAAAKAVRTARTAMPFMPASRTRVERRLFYSALFAAQSELVRALVARARLTASVSEVKPLARIQGNMNFLLSPS